MRKERVESVDEINKDLDAKLKTWALPDESLAPVGSCQKSTPDLLAAATDVGLTPPAEQPGDSWAEARTSQTAQLRGQIEQIHAQDRAELVANR
jgi:hypothetical protein